jgi:hypothetical protein
LDLRKKRKLEDGGYSIIRHFIISDLHATLLRWARHVVCMGEIRNMYKNVVQNHEGKRPLLRSICGWENNIKWILGKWNGRVWTGFIQLRKRTRGRLL